MLKPSDLVGALRRRRVILLYALLASAVVSLYWPVIRFELAGDDFLLAQLAHRAMHHPRLLLAPLGTFFRPTTTWTLVFDRIVWGTNASGYHLTNLLLRAVTTLLLFALSRRLGLSGSSSFVAALLWACSPLSSEPVYTIGARIDELLAICWFGLLLVFSIREGRDGSYTALFWVLLVLAMLSKETWVVIPVSLTALGWAQGSHRGWKGLLVQAPLYGASLVYAVLYFVLLPGDKGYYDWSLSFLTKLAHQAAALLQLEPLVPIGYTASWRGAIGIVALACLTGLALRWRSRAAITGAAILATATLPTLLVHYLPARYTALPFAGTLLLVVGTGEAFVEQLPERTRRPAKVAALAVAALVGTAGALGVRADLHDMEKVAAAQRKLNAEARLVAADVPRLTPVVVPRLEDENPLLAISLASKGTPKFFFVRHDDAYGLTDTAALFDWVVDDERGVVIPWEPRGGDQQVRRFEVLAHLPGRFAWLRPTAASAGAEAQLWRSRNRYVRLMMLVPADAPEAG